MSEKSEKDSRLPYTCTSAYDREACKGCEKQSKRKEHCNAYEGAYNY